MLPPLALVVLLSVGRAQTCDETDPCGCPADRDYATTMPGFPDGMSSYQFHPDFECIQRVTGDDSCEDYTSFVPDGTISQPELFLFFPGMGSDPTSTAHIPVIAAYAGHKTLSIAWDNQVSVPFRCADTSTAPVTVGGDCSDAVDCSAVTRNEMMSGVDDDRTPPDSDYLGVPVGYEGRLLSSVNQRVARALEYLHARDVSGGDPNDHNWLAYCIDADETGTVIDWSNIIVAGHSMGAGMASYIAYTNETAGLWVADSFGDYCDAPSDDLPSGELVDYLDPSSPRYLGPSASSSSGSFAALHLLSNGLSETPKLPAPNNDYPLSYDEAGYSLPGIDYDTAWTGSLGTDNLIYTTQASADLSGTAYHASMAESDSMPLTPAGKDFGADVQTETDLLHLFEGYLEGVCSL